MNVPTKLNRIQIGHSPWDILSGSSFVHSESENRTISFSGVQGRFVITHVVPQILAKT